MGRIVIVAYRPKPDCAAALDRLVADHVPYLRSLGLVSDRAPVVMRAGDGTVVEVFEWISADAIGRAHKSAEVQDLWLQFATVCDYVPVAEVAEAAALFSEFEAM